MDTDKLKRKGLEITPERFRPLLKEGYRAVFPENTTDPLEKDSVPGSLHEKHIRDVTVVPDRGHLLEAFPEDGIVAEIGVAKGDFAEQILSATNPRKFYLIDIWDSVGYTEQHLNTVKQKFAEELEAGGVEIIRESSEVALDSFDNEHFDWVYIDTSHTYEQTRIELEMARKKVKTDGIIAGHDYCLGNDGVIPAVHEFCAKHDWQISYITLETDGYWSFALETGDA